jgi:hypothetical protein
VRAANRGEFVEPSKSTLGEWPIEWLKKAITPPLKAQGTFDSYKRIIDKSIVPKLGAGSGPSVLFTCNPCLDGR